MKYVSNVNVINNKQSDSFSFNKNSSEIPSKKSQVKT